ncbi:nucleolar complex-associated protein 2 [Ricinus communis]|uniref:nucleolar complex-associated protein 2 n=1 Tax=Ricinus communis TaxID=3988 RepID=UPI0007721B25|nr:nucleolar complex-associated protein 2 [Ricinus communis]|eukprot:XP_015573724.1 nucleolar complex protein 2 homolog [Ricinus communis]
MDVEYPVKDLDNEASEEGEEEEEEEEMGNRSKVKSKKKAAKEHKNQLQRLQAKDPEFYQYLKEHDEELLQFTDEDIEEDVDTDVDDAKMQVDEKIRGNDIPEKEEKSSKNMITTDMVDSWCKSVRENGKIGPVRSLMKAFRIACHYGDDSGDDPSMKFTIMSSSVFNKIMSFVLSEMDGILRNLLGLPTSGGKKETINDLMSTRKWKNYSHLVKSYLGNALHVLNQMTDPDMISFTIRRIKYSSIFLSGFPNLLRKYIKVVLHFWGTGGGALPAICFLFLRELCIRLGSDCLDECFKGIYKAYVLNCQFINATKLQHIEFLGNCVIELLRVDLPTAYQHAFVFIRQLGMILRDAITMKTKESFRKVYEWKFINCLELWTGAVCAHSSEADFRPLAYPLTQIISGVARLVPTARYFSLRLRCVRMLNRIAASTGTFIPVSILLLDMLDMKELNRPPTGGVGKAVDLRTILKVSKPTLKTRAFQEACVFSVVEELAEHLGQWSYSVAFFELSFVPAVRLRNFCKTTKIERFRKEIRQLLRQVDANSKFTNEKRMQINFLPNDPAVTTFLEDEKMSGASPLSLYVTTLRQRAQQRNNSLAESSVLVGEHSSEFGNKVSEIDEDDSDNEKGAAIFSSSWLPGGESKAKASKEKKKKKKKGEKQEEGPLDEDVVEDLVLSSDEDGSDNDSLSSSEDEGEKSASPMPQNKKQNPPENSSKKRSRTKKSKKKSSGSRSPSEGKGDKAKPVPPKQHRKKPKPYGNLSTKNVPSEAKKRKRTN